MTDSVYLLCWTRRRVWLVGPFATSGAAQAWGSFGARSNKNDDPRWHSIEPDETTLRALIAYTPGDKRGFLLGAGWKNE